MSDLQRLIARLAQTNNIRHGELLNRIDDATAAALYTNANRLRPEQQAPLTLDWDTWLIMAGRGFGKTRAGTEWVLERAREEPGSRIALLGATAADARAVMVEGESGLLAKAPAAAGLLFEPSLRRLRWANTSTAWLYSAAEPEALRGPQFNYAWGDEAARWPGAEATLSNLRLALRLGEQPRLLLTTTPKPLPWLKALITAPGVVVTRGTSHDNAANLPAAFLNAVTRDYGGTRLGRQELGGEIIEDMEGALWTRALIEACRVRLWPGVSRTVIGVDPPASSGTGADACGIIVAALGHDGRGYVLADVSVQGLSPENWARSVAAAADRYKADCVVAEVNNGGDMVGALLLSAQSTLPLKQVRASIGKVARAEPVASLYANGRVAHVGAFPALEDELCGLLYGGAYVGPGRSPDRADAAVWALTELLLGKPMTRPGIRSL